MSNNNNNRQLDIFMQEMRDVLLKETFKVETIKLKTSSHKLFKINSNGVTTINIQYLLDRLHLYESLGQDKIYTTRVFGL